MPVALGASGSTECNWHKHISYKQSKMHPCIKTSPSGHCRARCMICTAEREATGRRFRHSSVGSLLNAPPERVQRGLAMVRVIGVMVPVWVGPAPAPPACLSLCWHLRSQCAACGMAYANSSLRNLSGPELSQDALASLASCFLSKMQAHAMLRCL
jgi:hypothetical protein